MKKSRKIWLGIATIWPIVYMFLFVASIFSLFIFSGIHNGGPPVLGPEPPSILFPLGFMGLFAVHLLTILGTLALTVFYIIRVFKTESLDQNMKIMWMLLLFFMGMLAQPVFWYLYIWRETPKLASPEIPPYPLTAGSQSSWERQAASSPREAAYVPPTHPPDWR
ncbi:MAG: hypothetical protein JWM21_69 [Acidobacteria bacterium]|nr:hypothetical protein [Acidobacteriota bacterium]